MPIRPRTLERCGEKQIILIDGDQTLAEALRRLAACDYQENQAYLVVTRADQRYQVALFAELRQVVASLGYDSFTLPVQALPIRFADRVLSTDVPQSGQEIVDWVAATPQSTVVVVEGNQVLGLLANPNRAGAAGYVEGVSLLELSGVGVQLYADPRARFEARVEPPLCPHCGQRRFFQFDPQRKAYSCPACGSTVEQL